MASRKAHDSVSGKSKTRAKTTKSGPAEPKRPKLSTGAEDLIDRRLTRALSHPLRVQILAVVNQRVISPNEFSREFNCALSNVAYHFRELEKLDCIELVEELPRRGSHEHFYRGARRGIVQDADWRQLGKAVQAGMRTAGLQDFVGRAVQAIVAGTFDARDNSHFSWTAIVLDDQGWDDLVKKMATMLDDVLLIEVEATERLAKSGKKSFPVTFSLAGFESPREEKGPKRKD